MNAKRALAIGTAITALYGGGVVEDEGRRGHRKTTPDRAIRAKIKRRAKAGHFRRR